MQLSSQLSKFIREKMDEICSGNIQDIEFFFLPKFFFAQN